MLLSICLTTKAEGKSWMLKALTAVKNYMDSSAIKGVDSCYIVAPKKPWQLLGHYYLSEMKQNMNSYFGPTEEFPRQDFYMDLQDRSRTLNILGVWIGYRGYGIGYSVDIGGRSGTLFTTSLTGGSYGLNLRLRTFRSEHPKVTLKGVDEDGEYIDLNGELELPRPIRVRTFYLDGYYLFNGKHFSYAAAYDQSVIQLRSSGSLMVGGMWQYTTIRYNDDPNAFLVSMMHDVGVAKIGQGSLGIGYAYNWVPYRGFLVNAMVMPMLTLYNTQEMEFYDAHMLDDDTVDNDYLTYRSSETYRSKVTVSLNARMSLTYNWKRLFMNVHGQWNRFRYNRGEESSGWINEWYVKTSIGVRF